MLNLVIILVVMYVFWNMMMSMNKTENFHDEALTAYSHGIARDAAQTIAGDSVMNADSHRIGWSGVDPGGKGVIEYSGPQNIMGVGDCRIPHYMHKHPMFINTDNVGCGSCIYNPLDPSYDGVLPDWQMRLRLGGGMSQGWASPPLDSEMFHVTNKKCEKCEKCNPCN
jgi:hypothetical protein